MLLPPLGKEEEGGGRVGWVTFTKYTVRRENVTDRPWTFQFGTLRSAPEHLEQRRPGGPWTLPDPSNFPGVAGS